VIKCRKEYAMGICKEMVMGSQIWFLGLVITVLLVIRGVELNPGCQWIRGILIRSVKGLKVYQTLTIKKLKM
jgi:hypothetical protein